MSRCWCCLLLCAVAAVADDTATYRIEVSQQPLTAIVAPLAEQSGVTIQVAEALAAETITLTTGALSLPRLLAILAANVGGHVVTLPAGGYRLAPRREGDCTVIPVKYMTASQIANLLGWPSVAADGRPIAAHSVPFVTVNLGDTIHRDDKLIQQSTGTRYRIETPEMRARREGAQAAPQADGSTPSPSSLGAALPGTVQLEAMLVALSADESQALGLPARDDAAPQPPAFGSDDLLPGDWRDAATKLRRPGVGQRLGAVRLTAVQSLPVAMELACPTSPEDRDSEVNLIVITRVTGDADHPSLTLMLQGGLSRTVQLAVPKEAAEDGQPRPFRVVDRAGPTIVRVPVGGGVLMRWVVADEQRPYRVLILTPTIAARPVLPQP